LRQQAHVHPHAVLVQVVQFTARIPASPAGAPARCIVWHRCPFLPATPMAPPISPGVRRAILAVLYFEVVTNVINGALCMIDPVLALQGMSSTDLRAPGVGIGLESARSFGAVSLVLGGFVLLRALNTPALKLVLQGLLLGDVLYLASLLPFTIAHGAWPLAAAPYALTAVMAAARAHLLIHEDWDALTLAAAAAVMAGKEGGAAAGAAGTGSRRGSSGGAAAAAGAPPSPAPPASARKARRGSSSSAQAAGRASIAEKLLHHAG
jgi:hypothetical protein